MNSVFFGTFFGARARKPKIKNWTQQPLQFLLQLPEKLRVPFQPNQLSMKQNSINLLSNQFLLGKVQSDSNGLVSVTTMVRELYSHGSKYQVYRSRVTPV